MHPSFEPTQVEEEIRANPLKIFNKGLNETPKVEHLEQIIEQQNFTNLALKAIGQQTERIENILPEKKEEANKVSHRFPKSQKIKQIKLPQNNGEKTSSSKNIPPMFNSHELDSKIKLGPSFSKEFISQISTKMTSLKLKDTINYLSTESSQKPLSSKDEKDYSSEDTDEIPPKTVNKDEVNKISAYKKSARF